MAPIKEMTKTKNAHLKAVLQTETQWTVVGVMKEPDHSITVTEAAPSAQQVMSPVWTFIVNKLLLMVTG